MRHKAACEALLHPLDLSTAFTSSGSIDASRSLCADSANMLSRWSHLLTCSPWMLLLRLATALIRPWTAGWACVASPTPVSLAWVIRRV